MVMKSINNFDVPESRQEYMKWLLENSTYTSYLDYVDGAYIEEVIDEFVCINFEWLSEYFGSIQSLEYQDGSTEYYVPLPKSLKFADSWNDYKLIISKAWNPKSYELVTSIVPDK